VMMVAAHKDDLRAAQRAGLKAAFVTRPREHGPDRTPDTTPDPAFDFNASDFNDLAKQLGV
jgi:2-haloacid dehalogenase